MKKTSTLLVALLLGGCAGSTPVAPPAERLVNVSGAVRIVAPAAKAFKLQSVRAPYELARLHHIDVLLANLTDSMPPLPVGTLVYHGTNNLSNDHTFDPISLQSLKANKHYQVTLRAFQVDPANGAESVPVEVDDQSSANTTDVFTTTNLLTDGVANGGNDQLTTTFPLQLSNQQFNGQAIGSVQATDGALVTQGPESMARYRFDPAFLYIETSAPITCAPGSVTLTPVGGGQPVSYPLSCHSFTIPPQIVSAPTLAWNVVLSNSGSGYDGQALGVLTATLVNSNPNLGGLVAGYWNYSFAKSTSVTDSFSFVND